MTLTTYSMGGTVARYLTDEEGRVSLQLYPAGTEAMLKAPWERPNARFRVTPGYTTARYNHQWRIGSLVQLHLCGDGYPLYNGKSLKYSDSTLRLHLRSQSVEESEGKKTVVTVLEAPGYSAEHRLTWISGYTGLVSKTTFTNEGTAPVTLELLSSFAIENLSPYHEDDAPNALLLHRFLGGWAKEAKHVCLPLEELGLDKSWQDAFCPSLRYGTIGSHTCASFFPLSAIEDRDAGVVWAAQLRVNGTWQQEITRWSDTVSFSGGLGDAEFGHWWKTVAPGESFSAPEAVITAVRGDIADACKSVVDLQNLAVEAFGEQGLPISFNEFCTTWGEPTQEKMLRFAEILKGRGVKYMVIDAGWDKNTRTGRGTWELDTEKFPDLPGMNRSLREMGYIPGIWFEFEVTGKGSAFTAPEYDNLHLKKNGAVISASNRTYWDFRKPEVIELLSQKVIEFLRRNGFGYLKVDYNGSIGLGCDGAESLGEGLKAHLRAVEDFFRRIKAELPDLIIENCASGGHRAEPVMNGLAAVTSSSDAHECPEVPYVYANLHSVMLPRQSLVWAVLQDTDTEAREIYTLAATFLGRMCLSGNIEHFTPRQWEIFSQAVEFYGKISDPLLDGVTRVYGNRSPSVRYAEGTQAVLRENGRYALLVCHAFQNADPSEIVIPTPWQGTVEASFYADGITLLPDGIHIAPMDNFTAQAVLIRK